MKTFKFNKLFKLLLLVGIFFAWAQGSYAQTVIIINTPMDPNCYEIWDIPESITFSGLPDGVTGEFVRTTMNSGDVCISGTPTETGIFNYTSDYGDSGTIVVTNADGSIPGMIVLYEGSDLQTTCVNTPISSIGYYTTGATGATFSGLPTGVAGYWNTNNNTVEISGTPTERGEFSYTVTVTGDYGYETAPGTITVPQDTITLTLDSYSGSKTQTVSINNPISAIRYSTMGTGATGADFSGLPPGVYGYLYGDMAIIYGNPTSSGEFSYTVNLTGGCGSATATGTITVTPLITLSSAVGTNAQSILINTPIETIRYSTTGATEVEFSGLPSGVTGYWDNNNNTAEISGTPTGSGSFNYTVTLKGGYTSASATGTITLLSAVGINGEINMNSSGNVLLGSGSPSATDKLVVDGLSSFNGSSSFDGSSSFSCFPASCGFSFESYYSGYPIILPQWDNALFLGSSDKMLNTIYTYSINVGGVWITSDRNRKENIRPLTGSLNNILKLNTVKFDYKPEIYKDSLIFDREKLIANGKDNSGFIAQEVQEVFPKLVENDEKGDFLKINFMGFIPELVQAIKERQLIIKALTDQIANIEANCCNANLKSASLATENQARLDQNIPNPFSKETRIGCYIPEISGASVLYIYNMSGTQLQKYSIKGKGQQTVTINGNSFVPGMYLYMLVVDGREVDTKQMILTK